MAATLLRRNPRFPLLPCVQLSNTSNFSTKKPNPIPEPISIAKATIRTERDPERIVSLFESSCSSPFFHRDRHFYSLAVRKLARAGRSDLVRRLLDGQVAHPSLPKTEGFFTRILSLYSESRLLDDAVDTFNRMPCARTDHSISALLSAFLDNRQLDRLHEFFLSVPKEIGVSPGVSSYNVLVKAYCLGGDLVGARKVFDEMRQKGLKPDIISYNTLLSGFMKKGDEDGFEGVLKEIKREGLGFNLVTYNMRILLLCAKGKAAEAEELLDVMVSKGVRPDRTSFNVIIGGFCKEGDLSSALRVFDRMQPVKQEVDRESGDNGNFGIEPSSKTYHILIESLVEKGEFGSALDVLEKCLGKKWAPPFRAMRGLVDGLVKSSQVGQAKDVVEMVKSVVKGDAADAWKKLEGEFTL